MKRRGARFTGERVIPGASRNLDEHLMVLRHLAAYDIAADVLAGASLAMELGSGEGYGARRIADRGTRVLGLEVDPDTVRQAAARYGDGDCSFVLYDGSRLPCREGVIDAALALQVIEHVEEDYRFVEELSRVLREGAPAVLTTPNAALRLNPGEQPWNRFHVREYEAQSLERLLTGAFGEVRIHGLVGSPAVLDLELRRLRRIRRLSKLDPLHLRFAFPEVLNRTLRALLRQVVASGPARPVEPDAQASPFEIGDFRLAETSEAALDLVAICRK